MKAIQRHSIHQKILSYLQKPEKILILEGVRQTGKTTAIQMATEGFDTLVITLTDETLPVVQLRQAETFDEFVLILKRDFGFTPNGSQVLVIDEAQKSITLHSFLMQMEREWKNQAVILSGSVMGAFFKPFRNSQKVSPAGRLTRIICRPFSFYEFLESIGQISVLQQIREFNFNGEFSEPLYHKCTELFYLYLTTGGYPDAIARLEDPNELFRYYQTLLSFFWQDADRYLTQITGKSQVQYGALFQTVLEAISRLTCQPSTRSSILSTDSPAYRTILPELLDAAEEWHFIFRLGTKMKTMTTKQGHNSKKYLWDVGVVNHLLNLSRTVTKQSDETLQAKLIETYVCQELVWYLETKDKLYSWKSHAKQSKEMDFLAFMQKTELGIEVKTSSKVNQKSISQLKAFHENYPQSKKCVVYNGIYKSEQFDYVPPFLLMRYLEWIDTKS